MAQNSKALYPGFSFPVWEGYPWTVSGKLLPGNILYSIIITLNDEDMNSAYLLSQGHHGSAMRRAH